MVPDSVWLVLFSLVLAGGQILFKRAAEGVVGVPVASLLPALAASPAMWGAVVLYGSATVLWVWILTRVPLSQAYPWAALGVVFVPLLAVLLLGEVVRPLYWVGTGLIAAGIVVAQLGVGS